MKNIITDKKTNPHNNQKDALREVCTLIVKDFLSGSKLLPTQPKQMDHKE